eukprot:evm.model.scf_428.2 EVM.evm.TU.scf_428.2   scf_428:22872-24928(-)
MSLPVGGTASAARLQGAPLRPAARLPRPSLRSATQAAHRVTETIIDNGQDVTPQEHSGVDLGRRSLMLGAATLAAALGAGVSPAAPPAFAAGVLQPEIYGDEDEQQAVFDTTTKAVRYVLPRRGRSEVPLLAGALLRAAFHDAGTFNAKDGSIQTGANGSLQYEEKQPQNAGLKPGIDVLVDLHQDLKKMNCPVTMADLIQIAGAESVAIAGGPKIKVPIGRMDVTEGSNDVMTQLPSPGNTAKELIDLFEGNTYTTQDLVALSGAHTIGKARFFPKTPPELEGTPKTFDNVYYKELLNGEGAFPSDRALVSNPTTKAIVETFASDKSAFFKAFEDAYLKMGMKGINAKNTVAPELPSGGNFCRFDAKLIRA